MKKITVTVMIACAAIGSSTAFAQVKQSKEQIMFYTSDWKGDRFPDGRPKLPDSLLERAKDMTIEDLWDFLRARGYDVQPSYSIYGQGKIAYTADDIDVLAAHIVPLNVWYILPIEAFAPSKSLRFYPDIDCKRARWEQYREAWWLMKPVAPVV